MGPSGASRRVKGSNLTPDLHCGVEIAASRSKRHVQNGATSLLGSLEKNSVKFNLIAKFNLAVNRHGARTRVKLYFCGMCWRCTKKCE
jgi:hypothetical protein